MEQQIGTFIRDLRTGRGLTQQQLADFLGITDKAVSKWERNLCCPDITLLLPLSEALGVTVTELLAGRREPAASEPPSMEEMVVSAVSYSENVRRRKSLDWRLLAFMGLTAGVIIAAATCMICDLAVSGTYTWSQVVYPSLGLGWLVCMPPLLVRTQPVRWTLAALTVSVVPYLCGLGHLLEEPLLTKISLWIGPMSLLYLWLSYLVCLRCRERKWQAAGWVLLLAAPLSAGINFVLDRYIGSTGYHEVWIALLAAAACFLVDYARERSV